MHEKLVFISVKEKEEKQIYNYFFAYQRISLGQEILACKIYSVFFINNEGE
jgi:hypothetical protein